MSATTTSESGSAIQRVLREHPLASFVAIAYGYTWIVMLPLLLQSRGLLPFAWPHVWEALAAFGPFLAAWLVLRQAPPEHKWRLREFRAAWRERDWGRSGWLLAVLGPAACFAVALLVAWLVPASSARLAAAGNESLHSATALAELLLISSIVQSVGEEPGWRGYMLPKLRERHSALAATLTLFPFWLFWHLPMFLTRPELGLGQFMAFAFGILSAAIWLTAVWEVTHSIGAAILWHVLANLLRGLALGVSTLAFLGFGTAVALGAIAIAIWLVRRERSARTASAVAAL